MKVHTHPLHHSIIWEASLNMLIGNAARLWKREFAVNIDKIDVGSLTIDTPQTLRADNRQLEIENTAGSSITSAATRMQ